MEMYTLYDISLVIAITILLVVAVINLSLIQKLKKTKTDVQKVKEQFNIIIIIYCIVHFLSIILNAKDSFTHVTFSFLFLIWPNIYFIYLESENKRFDITNYYITLYGSYVMGVVTLIIFFVFDFYDELAFPIDFFVWAVLLMVIGYYLYLFTVNKLYNQDKNAISKLALLGILITVISLLFSSLSKSLIMVTCISYIVFLFFFVCYCVMMNNSLIIQLSKSINVALFSSRHYNVDEYINDEYRNEKSLFSSKQLMAITKSLEALPSEYFYNSYLDLSQLASSLNILNHELSYFFSHHLATNFNQYINNIRVIKAKELLVCREYVDKSVKDIGEEVGFSSNASFYRAFKDKYGIPPSECRKKNVIE
ncbi:helix-turn-helix domain-containing protein [Myroides odoratimimus]|uniref:helix-turn-helix domain-containing protein n=1 Tax=Myroides odoratimimus TaxID=76832 RepID=UPI0031016BE0